MNKEQEVGLTTAVPRGCGASLALRCLMLLAIGSASGTAVAASATPEDALTVLQTAYFHEDVEAAVAARDFAYEARLELRAERHLDHPDDELVQQTAKVAEFSFRKQMKVEGFPAVRDRVCTLTKQARPQPDLVELVQDCILADGAKARQSWLAVKSAAGWRIAELPQ